MNLTNMPSQHLCCPPGRVPSSHTSSAPDSGAWPGPGFPPLLPLPQAQRTMGTVTQTGLRNTAKGMSGGWMREEAYGGLVGAWLDGCGQTGMWTSRRLREGARWIRSVG